MKTFTIFNDNDPNDSFEIEAETLEDAACKALSQLGWIISVAKKDEE